MAWNAIHAGALLLSTFATQSQPWLAIEADSEQRQPVYVASSPRELQLGIGAHAGAAVLPAPLQGLAERKLRTMARKLGESRFEVELWPAQNDRGRRTWAFARWRKNAQAEWKWISPDDAPSSEERGQDPETFFPDPYRTWIAKESGQVFDDFLLLDDLYAKPYFGDCIWTSDRGMEIYGAWVPLGSLDSVKDQAQAARAVCRVLPQPARLDGQPYELVVTYDSGQVAWPADVSWDGAVAEARAAESPASPIAAWPQDFQARYRDDVLALAGEADAVFPQSGRVARFTRKSSADMGNQLLDVASFLEERYAALGVQTRRQSFTWRGIPQANVIAVLPGSAPDHAAKPVLMADHYDTAFCEDTFAHTKERVSAPGADDNDTAAATLLRAAELLRVLPHGRDIWLVHLTGEEFPGDDLGARRLVSELLASGQDISGLVLMDMIGWHKSGDGIFQISAGDSEDSLRLAALAQGAALQLAPQPIVPVVRPRFDDRSYLYNTDGLIFSDAGYPVILINEHLNYLENLNRAGYHQTTDTSAKVDFAFAASIARVAIQTALSLAQ